MRVRIIDPGKTQYGALSVMADQLADAYRERGDEVVSGEADLTVSFTTLPDDCSGVQILVDHPLERALSPGASIGCVDRSHVEAVRLYFPESKPFFLPHPGCSIERSSGPRDIDILFTGGFEDPRRYSSKAPTVGGDLNNANPGFIPLIFSAFRFIYDAFLVACSQRLRDSSEFAVSKAKFRQISGAINPGLALNSARAEFYPWDRHQRFAQREAVLRVLGEAGLAVDVYGMGWDQFSHPGPHRFHGPVPFSEALALYARAKIVLHVGPNFPCGSHERVFSAMMAGAAVAVDRNPYWEETIGDCSLLYDLPSLPAQIADLKKNEGRRAAIAAAGQKEAFASHTWLERVRSSHQLQGRDLQS